MRKLRIITAELTRARIDADWPTVRKLLAERDSLYAHLDRPISARALRS